jgi:hypothetical protein
MGLCGFDSNAARRDLATARFLRVIISRFFPLEEMKGLESVPNPRRAEELWPDLSPEEETKQREQRERVARENAAYSLLDNNQCGRSELAGKSVAVPFVGAAAATLVVAEAIRLLHGGPAYTDIKPCAL